MKVLVVIVNLITIGCTFLIGFKLGAMQAIIRIIEYLNPMECYVHSIIVGNAHRRNMDFFNNAYGLDFIKSLLKGFVLGWVVDGMCSTGSTESDKEGSDAC